MTNDDSLKHRPTMHLTDGEYRASTFTLCIVVFCHSYLLISVFPYSGFMAMFLVPSANEENAGTYAGWIAASFMIGRSLTAYAWGICSDRYGRVRTLQLSLGLSGLATLLFGLSSNFVVALVWRFCLGLSNGLISTAKVVVSELADGDTDRECQTMNLVMSMWGGAFLIAPAMSGALAEPLKQYRAAWLQNTPILSNLLKRWPFLLPNLLGSIICVVGLICVHLFIMETLPKQKLRPIRSLVGDIWNAVWAWVPTNNDQESSALLPTKDSPSLYGGNNVLQDDDCSCEPDLSTSHGLTQRIEQDVQDAIRSSQLMSNNLNSALTTRRARQSIVTDIERRCQCAAGGRTGNICCKGMIGAEAFKRIRRASMRQTLPPATMSSLWANTRTRELMLVHWLGSFLMVALDEAFPLFCISIHAGGLGLLENSIAHVLSASGILFLVVQLVFYAPLIEKLGLFGSMSLATAIMPVLTVTLSVAGWLNQTASASSGQLSWTAFIFLTIDMAVARAADSTFFTGITVAINGQVPPAHRGTLNGLNNLGSSTAQAFGPIFAGLWVAFSFSSGFFGLLGAAFLFGTIAALNCITALVCYRLYREDTLEEAFE